MLMSLGRGGSSTRVTSPRAEAPRACLAATPASAGPFQIPCGETTTISVGDPVTILGLRDWSVLTTGAER